jgi:tetratricopeptide (TPR) repeat protein
MGMVLLAHDIRPQAAECFTRASALNKREPRWPYFLGLAQVADNPAAAAINFARAVRLFPERELAPRLALADTLLGLGHSTEAEKQYRAVLELEPGCARAKLGMGKLANSRGSAAEAAGFLAGATQDPSSRKTARRLLVTLHQRLGRTNEAEQVAKTLPELPADDPYPDPFLAEVKLLKTGEAAWTDLGDEWIKAGRVRDAAALLEKTVQTYPKSDRAMFLLGRARYRLGDLPGAEAMLARATQVAPASVEAQVQLGVVQLAQGHAQEAQKAFRTAIQAKPNLSEAWFNLGLSLGNDNRAESIAAFREAIRLKPNFFEAYLALALVLRADGQAEATVAELERALSLQPDEAVREKLLNQLKRPKPSTP